MAMATILVKGPWPFLQSFIPQPKEASYDIRAKLAQQLQRRSCLKMLTDRWTHGRTDGQQTKSDHNSSGELQRISKGLIKWCLCHIYFIFLFHFFLIKKHFNIRLYKEVGKNYTGHNLKTRELLDCELIGVCAVIRSNMVFELSHKRRFLWGTHVKWTVEGQVSS